MSKHPQLSNHKHLRVLSAEKDGEDGVLVKFSDGTVGGYVVEELVSLRPIREEIKEPKAQNPGQEPATHF
jgi:hypothetical protein